MSKCIGNLAIYRGMFVLYRESSQTGGNISMRFVGLDPEEATPMLHSIDQLVPDGARRIATFDNGNGLSDLLIAGKQLSWLSADSCIKGRRQATVISDSSAYADCTQLEIAKNTSTFTVWSLAASTVLSSQQFGISPIGTAPLKRTESIPQEVPDQNIDQFSVISSSKFDQKPGIITLGAVLNVLRKAQALAHAPEISAAREQYIGHFDEIIQLHDQLETKLGLVEAAYNTANGKLSETYTTLDKHLTEAKIASTAGSAASIIGVILLFTPAAPIGVGLTIGGAATTVGSSVAQSFFFEPDASEAFTTAISSYNTSSKVLEDLLHKIEDVKEKLLDSLNTFLTLVHTYPFPNSGPDAQVKLPEHPGDQPPDPPHFPNQFSNIASKTLALSSAGGKPLSKLALQGGSELGELLAKAGLKGSAEVAELLAKQGGKVLTKTLPMLGKAIPVLSIAVDTFSIVSTWTNSNETLEKITKLKGDLLANIRAFRKAVKTYQEGLEGQIGDATLRANLAKLFKLRKPDRPPLTPKGSCEMRRSMEGMMNVAFLMFINLVSDGSKEESEQRAAKTTEVSIEDSPLDCSEASTEDNLSNDPGDAAPGETYAAELFVKADLMKLGAMPMCAPILDSVFDKYADLGSSKDDEKHGPLASMFSLVGTKAFRSKCDPVEFGGKKVYNVSGSSGDNRASPWVGFWSYMMWANQRNGCVVLCKIDAKKGKLAGDGHSWRPYILRGGHMEYALGGASNWHYILPICPHHNKIKVFDRSPPGKGNWMVTKDGAWAIRIPAL